MVNNTDSEFDFYFTWTKQRTANHFNIVKSEGTELITSEGSKIFDFMSTNFQASFGHSNKLITENILNQIKQMSVAPPKGVFPLKIEVTKLLKKFLKLEKGKIFYTTSGAEAIENALKIARQTTGKKLVLARKKSYHGATLGALSVTGDWRGENHHSVADWTIRVPEPEDDPNLEETKKIINKVGKENIACFVLETISAMNGVIIPQKSWWDEIQQLAKENNILIILDEVSTGFGRTGENFAFHHYGLQPDIVCMSKAITGGYIPFGAIWTSEIISNYYEENTLSCGLTSYAHPLGLAAMKGVLENFNNSEFCENKKILEAQFKNKLEEIKNLPKVKNIKQIGLLSAIQIKPELKLNWEDGIKVGLHLAFKEDIIILAPPFVTEKEKLKNAFDSLKKLLT